MHAPFEDGNVLVVRSAPPPLHEEYSFGVELDLLAVNLRLSEDLKDDPERFLEDPTPARLRSRARFSMCAY